MEQIWDLVLGVTGDIQQVLPSRSQTGRRRLKRRELRAVVALQFMSHGKELRRLDKIRKEFNEFVMLAQKKR